MIVNLRQLTFTRFVAASWVVAFHYGASAYPFQLSGIKHVVAAGPVE